MFLFPSYFPIQYTTYWMLTHILEWSFPLINHHWKFLYKELCFSNTLGVSQSNQISSQYEPMQYGRFTVIFCLWYVLMCMWFFCLKCPIAPAWVIKNACLLPLNQWSALVKISLALCIFLNKPSCSDDLCAYPSASASCHSYHCCSLCLNTQ